MRMGTEGVETGLSDEGPDGVGDLPPVAVDLGNQARTRRPSRQVQRRRQRDTVRRLTEEINETRQRNRRSAELTCELLDLVRRLGLRPADLQGAQTGLRKDLLYVESRLRAVRRRSKDVQRRLWARV